MTTSINQEQYDKLERIEQKKYIKEWHCKCNECGKKWNYLDKVEKEINKQELTNACAGGTMCCNPCAVTATTNANTQLAQQKAKLKSCPECGSSNVTRTARYFKKQE